MRVSQVEMWAVAVLCGAFCGREARAVDAIFYDGFDGPKWFIDADSDGYGNPAVFVRSATQPAGYVANALDCDDSNAATYPGAADDPDGAFIDSNCDGIDGDIAKAVFVAPAGAATVRAEVRPARASRPHSPSRAWTRRTHRFICRLARTPGR